MRGLLVVGHVAEKLSSKGCRLLCMNSFTDASQNLPANACGVCVQSGTSLRLPEARALAARAVAATVEFAGAQDAETLTLAMRVGLPLL